MTQSLKGVHYGPGWIPEGAYCQCCGLWEATVIPFGLTAELAWVHKINAKEKPIFIGRQLMPIPDGASLHWGKGHPKTVKQAGGQYSLEGGPEELAALVEAPSKLQCLSCLKQDLDSRDLEINPRTNQPYGCFHCGSKKLVALEVLETILPF